LRLAECYLELLEGADASESANLRGLLDGAIESALEHLKHEPERVYALRLREELESST
jgi:hypothetical protein